MIYFDTSALVKLVHLEAETPALRLFLQQHRGVGHVSSELVRAELVRALRRLNYDDQGNVVDLDRFDEELGEMGDLIYGLDLLDVDPAVLLTAAGIGKPYLRTLDAIHLATAERLKGGLTAFVTYDRRLAAQAADEGLPVAIPQ